MRVNRRLLCIYVQQFSGGVCASPELAHARIGTLRTRVHINEALTRENRKSPCGCDSIPRGYAFKAVKVNFFIRGLESVLFQWVALEMRA